MQFWSVPEALNTRECHPSCFIYKQTFEISHLRKGGLMACLPPPLGFGATNASILVLVHVVFSFQGRWAPFFFFI